MSHVDAVLHRPLDLATATFRKPPKHVCNDAGPGLGHSWEDDRNKDFILSQKWVAQNFFCSIKSQLSEFNISDKLQLM